jgi:hypothetical protein
VGSKAGFTFGSSFFGLKKYWTIYCRVVCISFMIHIIQWFVLASPSASSPACVTASWVVMLFCGVECRISAFWLWRTEMFSQFFRGTHPSKSMLWFYLVVLSKLIVLSLPLLYLVGLEASFSLGTFLCYSSLQKCSTSDLVNLQKLSYSSSSIIGRS